MQIEPSRRTLGVVRLSQSRIAGAVPASGPPPPDTNRVSIGSGSAVIAQAGRNAKPTWVGTASAVGPTVTTS